VDRENAAPADGTRGIDANHGLRMSIGHGQQAGAGPIGGLPVPVGVPNPEIPGGRRGDRGKQED